MFATLQTPPGQSRKTVLDNIILLLTGTTDKNLLDFGGDATALANTSIISEVAAGWTKHSSAYSDTTNAGRASAVVRAPWHASNMTTVNPADISKAQYKFVDIRISNTGELSLIPGDDYDTLNPTYSPNLLNNLPNKQRINNVAGGFIFIYATPQCLGMLSYSLPNGYGSAGYGQPSFVFERQRGVGYDTQAANFSPIVVPIDTAAGFMSNPVIAGGKYKDGSTTGYGQVNAQLWVNGATNASPTGAINLDGSAAHQLHGFGVSGQMPGIGMPLGAISTLCDVHIFTFGAGSTQATAIVDGKTYMIWAIAANGLDEGIRLAIRMG